MQSLALPPQDSRGLSRDHPPQVFSPSSPLPCRSPGNRGVQAQSWFPRCQAITGAPFTCITLKKKVTARDTGALATCCHLPVRSQRTRRLFICPPDQLSKTRDSEVHTSYSLPATLAFLAPPPLIASPTSACQLKGKTALCPGSLGDPPQGWLGQTWHPTTHNLTESPPKLGGHLPLLPTSLSLAWLSPAQ